MQSMAAILLPSLLGLFYAAAVLLSWALSETRLGRVLSLTFFLSLCEWMRGNILTGFPWNLMGYVWDTPLLQSTAFMGIYGLSFLTILAACILYTHRLKIIFALWGGVFILWGAGYEHLRHNPTEETDVTLRLVQGSIPQDQKWISENFNDFMNRHIILSQLEAEKPLNATIWTEASVPLLIQKYPLLVKKLTEAAPKNGILLFGAPREEIDPITGEIFLYSSLLALTDKGQFINHYDKSHLVPFGEYIPLGGWLNLKKLSHGLKDYTSGKGLKTLTLPNLPPVGILICYEAIFPAWVVNPKEIRPHWLLNITNDAWFGKSLGPYQHLQIVRVRAIEEGLPLVRVANNGITAIIDSMGRILHKLDLDEIGFIDGYLPKPASKMTFYAQYNHLIYWLMMTLCFLLFVWTERTSQCQKPK